MEIQQRGTKKLFELKCVYVNDAVQSKWPQFK